MENELKKEKEWRIQLQASTETTKENVSQLSKDLSFYKKVAHVSYFILTTSQFTVYYSIKVIKIKVINWQLNKIHHRIMIIFDLSMISLRS